MIVLCNTFSPIDRVHVFPVDIGQIIKPTPVIDRVIEVDVAPIMKNVSIDYKNVFRIS